MRILTSALLALALGGLAAPAAAQVVLSGTQPGDLVNWPLREQTYCALCHSRFIPDDDYEPWDSWAGSMMANAARDPMFWAAVDIANQDSPGIGEFCIRCHSPRAWLDGRSSTPDGSAFLGTAGTAGGDFESIDCQFCHRLYEGPTGTPYKQNGQYWVDDGTPAMEPAMAGPYTDPQTPHAWRFSAYHRSSDQCALCHNLENPLVNLLDENGLDTGLPFPEQLTNREWEQSRFPDDGVECQGCHMPPVPGFVCNSLYPLRDEIPTHDLHGANTWMISVLQGLYGSTLGRSTNFDRAYNLALDNLQNESAVLWVGLAPGLAAGDTAAVNVRVINLTGHKLPTGYPEGRRMWLHVTVRDAMGATLYESGRYDTATATLIEDADIKVYETKHGQHGGGPGFHLALSNRIYKDNRIPPAGFRPDASTAPVGASFEILADGTLANWDLTRYDVPIPAGTVGPLGVTASLYYQTTSREYVEFLRDENVSGPDPHDPSPTAPSRGDKIWTYWDTYGRSAPVLMKTQTRSVELGGSPLVGAQAPEPHAPRIVTVGPNPFRGRTEVTFEVPRAAGARLTVYDVAGRRVRTLASGTLAAGTHVSAWDGSTPSGAAAVSGSYLLRLDVVGHSPVVKRVLLLR